MTASSPGCRRCVRNRPAQNAANSRVSLLRRSGIAGAAEPSIEEALRRSVQQAPLPFAVTRGEKHTLVYANTAFCHLAGVAPGDAQGVRVAATFPAIQRRALSAVLDRAFRDGVEILDERIPAPGESM